MVKYQFNIVGNQLVVSLTPVDNNVEENSMSYMSPSFKNGNGKLNLYESGIRKQSFLFTEIGDIEGSTPISLEDAFNLLTNATANFNGGGTAPTGGLESLTGDFINNTDPLNPTINVNEVNLGQIINDRLAIKLTPSVNDEIVMLDSITGEAVTAYYNSFGYVPLSGTTEGNPVTGDIEMSDATKIFVVDGVIRIGGVTSGISIANDNPNNNAILNFPETSKGLSGQFDYSPNIEELDYTQKIYVDAPSTQTQTQRSTQTSGTDTINFDGRNGIYIHEAGLTTALNINLPSTPVDSQIVTIMSVGGIATLTLATAVGTIIGAVTALTALVSVKFIWLASENKWYKIQ